MHADVSTYSNNAAFDLLLFFAIYHSKLNVYGLWAFDTTFLYLYFINQSIIELIHTD